MSGVLITGGAGFIGSHLTRDLLAAGHEVTVLDFFNQYICPAQPTFLENVDYRFSRLLVGANIIRGATTNKNSLTRALAEVKPEYIVHLAALPLANVALKETEEAFDSILQGTSNMLEILRTTPVKKFVYVSSSMVYGDFTQVPMPEDGPKNPKEIYGGMKYAGEILVNVFAKQYDIPFAIVRPSAVYGPSDNNYRVLQIFLEKAVKGEPIKVTNPETTFLDFSFVEDVADGLLLVTLSDRALNDVFNITRGEQRSLADAIEILRLLFPDLQVITVSKTSSFRPARGTLDISKARELLGYQPRHSLEQGLVRYTDYVQRHNRSLFRRVDDPEFLGVREVVA